MQQDLQTSLNQLIARRARLGLCILAAGIVLFSVISHLVPSRVGLWSDGLNGIGLVLVAIIFALLSRPAGQSRPVPLLLLGVALLCTLRTLGGIWGNDVVPTVLTGVTLALMVGGTMPWGVAAQVAAAAMVGAAIAVNAAVVLDASADAYGRSMANIVTALGASVVLAYELKRNHVRWFAEILERRRMQDELARLNADLERRVGERTAALAAATDDLRREARQRQAAAAQQRATEKRLQDILDNAPAAIHVKDADGRYILVNRRADAILAKPGATALGTTVRDAVPAEMAEALLANDRAVLERRAPLQFEEVMFLDGAPHTFLSVKFPLYDASGAPVAVGGISTDITDRKATEAELQRAEARERAHQAELAHVLRLGTMGEMASSLAHEINQPLGAIANYAQGCARRLRNGAADVDALLPVIEKIGAEALRAGEVIRR
ncbi:MAG: PAS domain-containing protein, partial [Candidatus Binatia bacterium]